MRRKDEQEKFVEETTDAIRKAMRKVAAMTPEELEAAYGDFEKSRFWEDWTDVDVKSLPSKKQATPPPSKR